MMKIDFIITVIFIIDVTMKRLIFYLLLTMVLFSRNESETDSIQLKMNVIASFLYLHILEI